MTHRRPDRRTFELDHIWHSLPTEDRTTWLRLARSIAGSQVKKAASLFDLTAIIAAILVLVFPSGLRYTLLAIGGGYVMAVNLAIMKVCFETWRVR